MSVASNLKPETGYIAISSVKSVDASEIRFWFIPYVVVFNAVILVKFISLRSVGKSWNQFYKEFSTQFLAERPKRYLVY